MRATRVLSILLVISLIGCDGETVSPDAGTADGGGDAGPGGVVVPDTYAFESRFTPDTSSVSHGGQTARHVLIADLKAYIGGLTAVVDSGFSPATDGEVVANLDYFFGPDAAARAEDPIGITTEPPAPPILQTTYGELSGTAFLLEKLAGNDTSTDYRDWSTEFVGWSDPAIAAYGGGITSPTLLVRAFFETIEQNAMARAGNLAPADTPERMSPVATPMELPVHVTASGLDLQQLVEKLLLSAIAFHQAADDYTDDDVADKGLLSDNVAQDGTNAYTVLEHAWDEAYGYFGASAEWGTLTPEQIATGPRFVDFDDDGSIDLRTEYNFGASVNAGSRDHASAASARTSMVADAWLGFRTGRAIITQAGGALTEDQMTDLRAARDMAIGAWEAALAATVVHYINDVLAIMVSTDAYDHARFLEHAKAWSEMKGFALAFQFNPRSPVTATQFAELNTLLGDAPVLPSDAGAADYRADLIAARAILGAAFAFDAANLGDDQGATGW